MLSKSILASFIGALVCIVPASAAKISGTVSGTVAITEDSELSGDVTCTVTGAPCISINAPGVTLDLHGYTITGQGDPQTGCSGGATNNEFGILVNSQVGVTIHGPGVVQRFRATGIQILTSTGTTVNAVTTATNCNSGILVAGGAANEVYDNVSIRNGNGSAPCGGI
ncbi:MAG TPA: hypothetical protein VNX18_05080 [Bryobacteraceae bacterium]|nr:hypothetical protein [Bryobacteraceae bacterium]